MISPPGLYAIYRPNPFVHVLRQLILVVEVFRRIVIVVSNEMLIPASAAGMRLNGRLGDRRAGVFRLVEITKGLVCPLGPLLAQEPL
jgi:hypothetical protein